MIAFRRNGPHWLDSDCGRWKICRILDDRGFCYAVWNWWPDDGVAMPECIGVKTSIDEAMEMCT